MNRNLPPRSQKKMKILLRSVAYWLLLATSIVGLPIGSLNMGQGFAGETDQSVAANFSPSDVQEANQVSENLSEYRIREASLNLTIVDRGWLILGYSSFASFFPNGHDQLSLSNLYI